jgi:hypothetical protein
MSHMRRCVIGLIFAAMLALAGISAMPALAHNAGHVILPNGQCVNVGSSKEAPQVPESNPNRNDLGQLDLIEDPNPGTGLDTRDQYGARYAAEQGNSNVRPGNCP